jgi:glycosyltransferase involved in cell wall biosynthesis
MSFLPKLRRVPVVATVQGLDFRREKWGPIASGVLRMSARACVTFPDRTVVVSRELRRWFRETYRRDTTYIPNGVDLGDLNGGVPVMGLEPDKYILFLGRLVPEKQVHVLIEAFRMLDTNLKLAIVGSSSHSDGYVDQLRRAAGQDERVLMLGSRYGAERAWLMRNAALFAQPSTIEGLPIALLEAMACDRYPVVSDIAENLEPPTTDDGVLGSVFRTGDPIDLARALAEALRRPDRVAVGTRAGEWVREQYDWDHVAAQTEAVYREVAAVPALVG